MPSLPSMGTAERSERDEEEKREQLDSVDVGCSFYCLRFDLSQAERPKEALINLILAREGYEPICSPALPDAAAVRKQGKLVRYTGIQLAISLLVYPLPRPHAAAWSDIGAGGGLSGQGRVWEE
jgi:hypothetical protein